jgi:hypothetical protein
LPGNGYAHNNRIIVGSGVFYLVLAEVIMRTTDRGLAYRTKGRIFNNMLYMRYVHLKKRPTIFI